MSFHETGSAVVEDLISPSECDALVSRIDSISRRQAGSRSLLEHEWCRSTAEILRTQLACVLDGVQSAFAIQCTYFREIGDKNWLVPWHQDRSIPVDAEDISKASLTQKRMGAARDTAFLETFQF